MHRSAATLQSTVSLLTIGVNNLLGSGGCVYFTRPCQLEQQWAIGGAICDATVLQNALGAACPFSRSNWVGWKGQP